MSDLLSGDGRTHVRSGLMRESLVSSKLIAETDAKKVRRMVPDVCMVAIGGRSIMDRGREAILPLVDEIAGLKERHKIVMGVGGGARARHTYAIGLDLGLPLGGLARIVGGVEENNRDILQFLLAPHGGITFIKDHFQDLQLFLANGMIPICIGQPPYHFWEPPSKEPGRLPDNGPDVGLFLQAEVIGAERMVYVKDVDGVFTNDPHKDDSATLIEKIGAAELLERKLPDMPVERELLRTLENARSLTSVQVINGLVPGNIGRALDGEPVGTIIYSSRDGDRS
ncbi:MAG: uridine kinase [Gammaproteobacteria bacterium]|nr:uridine kinase [Gammaproteobacteria bacterium]NNF61884.1 uridine kinase [Gammaproteobacteria bacterium]NNM19648.1 uridine kinase [Gammaproteobacteria bacterium]